MAIVHLPSAFEAEAGELGSLLPHSSEAIEVEQKAIETFGLPLLSRTMVVARQPRGFSRRAGLQPPPATSPPPTAAKGPDAVKAVPIADAPGMLGSGRPGDDDRRLPLSRPGAERRRIPGKRRALRGRIRPRHLGAGGEGDRRPAGDPRGNRDRRKPPDLGRAGDGPARGRDPRLYFRSLGIPLLWVSRRWRSPTSAPTGVLGWIAERYGLSIPREAEPVIVALIFGVLTDYLVFFVSGYRQRLRQGAGTVDAVGEATSELLPVILTAALMIAGATLTLLLSGVRFLSAFGPSMAVAVIVSALVAMTLVPAALAIFGRALLWPRGLAKRSAEEARRASRRPRARPRRPGAPARRRRPASGADRARLRRRPAGGRERIAQPGAGQPGDARAAGVERTAAGL